ncbi:hypothetical protein AB0G74_34175 [Streptomyces sp. NPDC020875]|uniref:hypothetical protein n=1 Tax=Streptomyces sp. NPDC020875 TaxID=3154898 RepID=UPI00340A6027
MSIRKMFAAAAVVAAVAGAGLMTAPTAQAADTGTTTSSVVQPTRWTPWGSYANLGQCHWAGNWAVMNAGASYFDCAYNAQTNLYDLFIWRP